MNILKLLSELQCEYKTATTSSQQSTAKQISQLAELKKALAEKREELAQVNASMRTNGDASGELTAKGRELGLEISTLTSQIQEANRGYVDQQSAISTLPTTYNELVEQNRALSIAMRDVPLADTSGKLQELQKQYLENNVKLKAFDASIGNSQRNVGNYKTALTGIEDGLSGLASAIAVGQGPLGPLAGRINAVASTLRKFTKSSGDAKDEVKKITTATKVYNAITLKVTIPTLTAQAAGWRANTGAIKVANTAIKAMNITLAVLRGALIATGIGAIVIALASLYQYFKRSEEGAMDLERRLNKFSVITMLIKDGLAILGGVMVKAFEDPVDAVEKLWTAIKENIVNRITAVADIFIALKDIIVSAMKLDTDGIVQGAKDMGNAVLQSLTGVENLGEQIGKSYDAANKKYQATLETSNTLLARQQQNILLERAMGIERSKQNRDLQETRALVRDETKSLEERLDALRKVRDAEIDLAGRELALEEDKLDVLNKQKNLGLNNAKDNEELAEQQKKVFETQQSYQEKIMRLQRDENALQRQLREFLLTSLREQISTQERVSNLSIMRVEDQMTKAGNIVELALLKQKAFEDNLEQETSARFLAYRQEYLNADFSASQATSMAIKRANDELEMESLEINKEVEDTKMQRAVARSEAVFRYEAALRQSNFDEAIFHATNKGNKVLELEMQLEDLIYTQKVTYMDRLATRSAELRAQGISAGEAAIQAEMDIKQADGDARIALERRLGQAEFDTRQEYLQGYLSLAKNVANAIFGENKAVAAASAIVDTYSGAVAALGKRPWTEMNYVYAASVIAAGIANVRKILSVNKSSTTASATQSASPSQTNVKTGFGLVDVGTNAPIAEQVAMGASPARQSMNPTFVFQGDLDPEFMTIKVKQGSDAISSRTIGVGV